MYSTEDPELLATSGRWQASSPIHFAFSNLSNTAVAVNRHVEDLHELVSACQEVPLAMIGHSWGAMLALAYAAAHPDGVASLILVGCGTFDTASRNRMRALEEQRMDEALRRRLYGLSEEVPDRNERLRVLGNLLLPQRSATAAARSAVRCMPLLRRS